MFNKRKDSTVTIYIYTINCQIMFSANCNYSLLCGRATKAVFPLEFQFV